MRVNTDIAVRQVRVEHHHSVPGIGQSSLGIDEATPRLSWSVVAPEGWRQRGYEVELRDALDSHRVAVYGPIAGTGSLYVPWPAPPLASRQGFTLRIRVRGEDQEPSPWSDPYLVERGLSARDWTAKAVRADVAEDPDSDRRPSILRRAFTVDQPVLRARLRITGHGLFEAELNGERVGRDALAPGWTVYHKRLTVHTYDVTGQLTAGENVLGVWLGDGWYRGRLGFSGGNRNLYGCDLSLIAQLEIDHPDGTRQVVATDEAWKAAPGPILFSGIYDGEVFDAREVQQGWSAPGFDDSAWGGVEAVDWDTRVATGLEGPPVQQILSIPPVTADRRDGDRIVLDFGQNLVGRLAIRATGAPGERLVIRHAEVLQGGELYVRPLRLARATDEYVFATGEEETWEPRFTFHGFRYVEVQASPAILDSLQAEARVYHSAMERTGWFECSDPSVNRLHENVLWSMRGNFVGLPTDCPQRDERLGWTGDIQVFTPTAMTLFDASGMLSAWLKDLAAEQLDDGTVPWYVPVIPGRAMWTPIRPGAAWGDAAVLTPWDIWCATGDKAILERQWPSAKAWVDLIARRAGATHLWLGDFQLGDWLDPSAPPENPAQAMTDKDLVASCYFAWSTRILARTAEVLGYAGDAARYHRLADRTAAAIRARYLTGDGRLENETQTGYSMLICFELVDGELLRTAGERLRALVEDAGYRISTGFVGTPLVSKALSATGSLDTAYRLLLERECPSWLYAVDQGATTVWERWDSLLEDGTVNPGQMTSFNHYALGAVAKWLYSAVAGLEPVEPGWRRIRFRPGVGGGLTSAKARVTTGYGDVAIGWEVADGELRVETVVPHGTTAELISPDGSSIRLGPGGQSQVFALAENRGSGEAVDSGPCVVPVNGTRNITEL